MPLISKGPGYRQLFNEAEARRFRVMIAERKARSFVRKLVRSKSEKRQELWASIEVRL